jgi:hypothetical protein
MNILDVELQNKIISEHFFTNPARIFVQFSMNKVNVLLK